MQNIDIRFSATSNFGQVESQMAALKAQAQSLAASFGSMGYAGPKNVNATTWQKTSNALDKASAAYRNAASSSGLLNTQQIRTNSEVKKYTDLMSKQKLGLRDMLKNQNLMKEAYRDQLRMRRMTAQSWGTDTQGRQVVDITTPKNVPHDLDNMRNKIGFISQGLKSAGSQMINLGKNTQWAGRQLMVGFTMPVAIFGAVAGKLAYDVDMQMTRIQKVYDTSTNSMIDKEKELNSLRADSMKMAKDAANEYGAAVKDTLGVEADLAATGVKGPDLTAKTKEIVRIATLGEMDFPKTTQMAISLQSAFRDTIKTSDDLAGTFNYLNALENSTSLSLQDMTDAIPRAASAFGQLGGSVKDLGVLMTAMKESGVDPASGANALKSASTRIINPVPKAVEFYKKQGIDIEKITKETGGNLFEFLKKLGKAQQGIVGPTDKATKLLRAQGVAMLFGTYQNNRLTAALRNVGDAYAGVHNQAWKAVQVGKMTRKELDAIASGEIAIKMQSASGKFSKAIEGMKASVSEMGKPFLKAATDILGILKNVVDGFNSLPDGTKNFIMWGAIITAVVGPLIMLSGLFLNLAGHITGALGSIGLLTTRFKFLTTEQQLARLTTEAVNKELAAQTKPVNSLALELDALAGAYGVAAKAANDYLTMASKAAMGMVGAARQTAAGTGILGNMARRQQAAVFGGRSAPVGNPAGFQAPLSSMVPRGFSTGVTPQAAAPLTREDVSRLLGGAHVSSGTGVMAGVTPKVNKNGQVYMNQAGGRRANAEQIAAYRQLAMLSNKINLSETNSAAKRQESVKAMNKIVDSSRRAIRGQNGAVVGAGSGLFAPGTRGTPTPTGAPKSSFRPLGLATQDRADAKAAQAATAKSIAGQKMLNSLRSGETKIATGTNGILVAQKTNTDNIAKSQNENVKTLHSGAKAAGAMQLAMAASMMTSGKLQHVLMGTTTALFALSAAQQLNITGKIADSWKTGAMGAGRLKTAGTKTFSVLSTGAKKFGAALLGPWGLAAAAVVGFGYLVYKHMKEPERQQEAINRSVDTWVSTLGVVKKKYDDLNLSINNYKDNSVTPQQLADKLTTTEDGKRLVSSMKSGLKDNKSYADMLAAQEYIKILTQTNATAEDAQRAIEALFLASDEGFFKAATHARELRDTIGDTISNADTSKLWSQQISETLDADSKQFDERAKGIAAMLNEELKRAPNPGAADKVLVRFTTAFDGVAKDKWLQNLPEDVRKAFKKANLEGDDAMNFMAGYKQVQDSMNQRGIMGPIPYGTNAAQQDLASKLYKTNPGQMLDAMNALKVQKELVQALADQLGVTEKITSIDDLRRTEEWQVFLITKKNAKEMISLFRQQALARRAASQDGPGDVLGMFKGQVGAMKDVERLNVRLRKVGLPEVKSLDDKINWSLLKQKEAQRDVNKETDKAKDKLSAALKVWQEFSKTGWKEAAKGAYTAVTSAVGDQLSSNFDSIQQRESDRLQAGQERAQRHMENVQQHASDALDRRIASREKALDARGDRITKHFDKLADKANAYYDHRIAGVNNAIKAEQDADAERQRLFDREMTRIQRLAEAQNRNIDFNMAVNQGQFDEAAKIQNDASAAVDTNAYEDAGKAADAASQKRQDALQKQIDRLEKKRDARLKNVDAARAGAEKALQIDRDRAAKQAEIEKKALEKSQERQKRAMERRQAAEKKELENRQAREKASFQMQLALLNSYIPKSEKDLREHMKRLASRYDQFGQAYAKSAVGWGSFIKNQMTQQMKIAANNLKSEVNWAGAGHDAGAGMISGMASSMGMSVGEFRKWLGVEGGGKRPKAPDGGGGHHKKHHHGGDGHPTAGSGQGQKASPYHEGGLIGRGKGGSGRTGFTGSQSPHSEKTINAKIGEYVVKDSAVQKYGVDTFDALNNGKVGVGGATGATGTMGSFILGAAGTLMAKAVLGALRAKVQNVVDTKVAQEAAISGSFGNVKGGKYGGSVFSGDQLKNAAVIANVGKQLGASKRDIEIALMTAMQESTLRNLPGGDRDSVGLFQQRSAWGSFADRTNPAASAKMFFLGGHQGQRGLFDFKDRDKMSLASAAQAVQVSAYPSAYAKWQDEAAAIMKAMAAAGGGSVDGGFVQGAGGRHRPMSARWGLTQGIHDSYTGFPAVDIGAPVGNPVYAVANGTVKKSYDLHGYESRNSVQNGYRSYGRVIEIDHGGFSTLYAHLSRRSIGANATVKGGAKIGLSGNTGHSTGPHLHFGAQGASPYAFLKTGGTIKHDGTPAILHRNERVLTAPLTAKLDKGIENLSDGPMQVTIDMRGAVIREDVDIKKAVYAAIDARDNKKGRRRVIK